ncbi:MAG: hypothetical protein CSA39_01990 [Flavobacteriales bacterium]|nr:MAG: hypothetical protein CSA39_01990 [Flavobacteriales bacterium]
MKKSRLFILLIFGLLGCEEVIDIKLPEASPKLVIDASINWLKNTDGKDQYIKLSLTTPYFYEDKVAATGAEVYITHNNNIYLFKEDKNSGIYITNNFKPELMETYELTVKYEGATYKGTEQLFPIPPITRIQQSQEGGIYGEDYEIKAYYEDPKDEENYYLFRFENDIPTLSSLEVYRDEFINGNEIFAYYSNDKLIAGSNITITSYGISKQFYEYMYILLQQNSIGGGGPFETQPATVRGNCVNITNPDDFPLGYFRLSEMDKLTYTLK